MSAFDIEGPDIHPRLLRAFLAVAAEGHFGRAAERLSMAQPALSRQVKQLEELLKVPLLMRTPGGATLTEAGERVRPEAQRLMTQHHRLLRAASAPGTQPAPTVTITGPLPDPGGLMTQAVRVFRERRPWARVVIAEHADGEQGTVLENGRIDVVLSWGELSTETFVVEELVQERTTLMMSKDHPLAASSEVPLSALAHERILYPVRERSHCWGHLKEAADRTGVRLDPIPTAAAAVVDLITAGLGVGPVPESFRRAGFPGLVLVPIAGLSERMSVVRRRCEESPLVLDFVQACREAAGELIADEDSIWTSPGADPRLT